MKRISFVVFALALLFPVLPATPLHGQPKYVWLHEILDCQKSRFWFDKESKSFYFNEKPLEEAFLQFELGVGWGLVVNSYDLRPIVDPDLKEAKARIYLVNDSGAFSLCGLQNILGSSRFKFIFNLKTIQLKNLDEQLFLYTRHFKNNYTAYGKVKQIHFDFKPNQDIPYSVTFYIDGFVVKKDKYDK